MRRSLVWSGPVRKLRDRLLVPAPAQQGGWQARQPWGTSVFAVAECAACTFWRCFWWHHLLSCRYWQSFAVWSVRWEEQNMLSALRCDRCSGRFACSSSGSRGELRPKNIPEESKFQLTEFTLLPSGVTRLTMLIPSALKSRIICNSLQIKAFLTGSQFYSHWPYPPSRAGVKK